MIGYRQGELENGHSTLSNICWELQVLSKGHLLDPLDRNSLTAIHVKDLDSVRFCSESCSDENLLDSEYRKQRVKHRLPVAKGMRKKEYDFGLAGEN